MIGSARFQRRSSFRLRAAFDLRRDEGKRIAAGGPVPTEPGRGSAH